MSPSELTFFADSGVETCIEFKYAGHSFTLHNPLNDFWLIVEDAACPEQLLREVADWLTV